MNNILTQVEDLCTPDLKPKQLGKGLVTIITPKTIAVLDPSLVKQKRESLLTNENFAFKVKKKKKTMGQLAAAARDRAGIDGAEFADDVDF